MSNQPSDKVIDILKKSGFEWILEQGNRDELLEQIASDIKTLSDEIDRRILNKKTDLFMELLNEPMELKPLIQLLASPTSNEMRVMAYCVLRGMEIENIEFSYSAAKSIQLTVRILDNVNGKEHSFHSNVVWDVEILKQLGIMSLNKKPILEGFYTFAT